jgi:hypothetical protein
MFLTNSEKDSFLRGALALMFPMASRNLTLEHLVSHLEMKLTANGSSKPGETINEAIDGFLPLAVTSVYNIMLQIYSCLRTGC